MKENEKRVSSFDVLLTLAIFALALVLLFAAIRYASLYMFSPGTGRVVEYAVLVTDVPANDASRLVIGDRLYDGVSGKTIGRVIGIQSSPSENDTARDLTVRVAATADTRGRFGVTVGGVRIAAGRTLSLYARDYAAEGECIALTVGGERHE